MNELVEGVIQVGRDLRLVERSRIYTYQFRWLDGTSKSGVVYECELPRLAKFMQKALDESRDMDISQRLKFYDELLSPYIARS